MAVIIIAVTPDDDVLFVEQYRVPLGARTIEMPAGLVGDDHAARHAGRRRAPRTDRGNRLAAGARRSAAGRPDLRRHEQRTHRLRPRDGLIRVGDGGGVDGEDITVHAVPRSEAPAWLMQKSREGFELDLKLWAGLWMIERNPDGSLRTAL